ncbi:MAG: zinc ribbon domain-containing protein [Opitutaceae bacterium]
MSAAFQPPGDCPNCGETVPGGARACPHCGADERTGWSDETYLDGVALPEDESARAAERPVTRAIQAWLLIAVFVVVTLGLSGVVYLLR